MAAIAPGGASFALATPDGHLEMRRWSDNTRLSINNGYFGATSIAYSADGTLFAAATGQGAKVWRVSDGTLLTTIPELTNLQAIGVSNDGTVVAGRDNVQLYISRAAGILTIPNLQSIGMVGGIAVSPDGSQVAGIWEQQNSSISYPHSYFDGLWRVSDGQLTWSHPAGSGFTDLAPPVFYSPDGTMVVFGIAGGQSGAAIRKASDGSTVASLSDNQPMAFSADGAAVLAAASVGNSMGIIRVSDGVGVRTISFPFAGNPKFLAAGFSSGLTTIAIEETGVALLPLFTDGTQTGSVQRVAWQNANNSLAISPDGTYVGSGDLSGATRVWNTVTSTVTTLPSAVLRPQAIAISSSGTVAVCGDSAVSFGNGQGPAVQADAVAFSPDGTLLATGDRDNTAKLWKVADSSLVQTFWSLTSGHTSAVEAIGFSADGARVVTGALDRTIKIWDVATGANLGTIKTGFSTASAVSFSPDGTQVIGFLTNQPTVNVWDIASGTLVHSMQSGSNAVVAGSTLFAGDNTSAHGIDRYSWPDLGGLGTVPLSSTVPGYVGQLAITQNGSVLASANGASSVVHFWCSH
jgi:WD40 repeat protein